MVHKVKILPEYFSAILYHKKRFEIRFNDRNYQVGDTVLLCEYEPTKDYFTGRELSCKITYITNFMQKDNYIVFSFEILQSD